MIVRALRRDNMRSIGLTPNTILFDAWARGALRHEGDVA